MLGNWQYAAGVGADPREDRYFNIIKQAHDYDPDSSFMKIWCPELQEMPSEYLKNPLLITESIRQKYGISHDMLPPPIVPLQHSAYNPMLKSRNKKSKSSHGRVPGLK